MHPVQSEKVELIEKEENVNRSAPIARDDSLISEPNITGVINAKVGSLSIMYLLQASFQNVFLILT